MPEGGKLFHQKTSHGYSDSEYHQSHLTGWNHSHQGSVKNSCSCRGILYPNPAFGSSDHRNIHGNQESDKIVVIRRGSNEFHNPPRIFTEPSNCKISSWCSFDGRNIRNVWNNKRIRNFPKVVSESPSCSLLFNRNGIVAFFGSGYHSWLSQCTISMRTPHHFLFFDRYESENHSMDILGEFHHIDHVQIFFQYENDHITFRYREILAAPILILW